ncbi:hypothetical protein [Streptomyces sp. NRRL B-24484]|uniref:hypothetical protein n=1 Tax=Streptomyces sp. NRRL B-24484 TaxID=1463833 RepID=UPI00069467D8|nr:hypothetical protein [Streptomyces sp. NRRL B-24484]
MPEFTIRTLAIADDTYDRDRASDGHSRYGAYLDRNAGLLHDDGAPLTAAEFAFSTWQIATSPVMAPGYVRIRPDLHSLTVVSAGEDGHDVALRVSVPLRHRTLATWPARMVADWQADPWATDHGFTALTEPEPAGRTALLVTATLLIPVPAHILHAPTVATPGLEMTRQAKQAVKALTGWANDHAHLVNELNGGAR